MNAINYNKETEKIIAEIKSKKLRKKLFLHACCAPCASACIERVKDFFDLTVFFYNPNMDTAEEYALRAEETERLCKAFGVNCIIAEREQEKFYAAISGYEDCPEGGSRCERCFTLRLKKTAETAKESGYDYFTTTLTLSPLKNAELINSIGKSIGEEVGISFLPSDFKKKGGYLRSIELSREYDLYRQNYCGCEFSKNKNP